MRIIHTADLHLGQVIYQNYDRSDEHRHFFRQLEEWCVSEQPDALLVSGDVFDIQQPSATVKKAFTESFVGLHRRCPDMAIVIVAGNHDSASRIQADSAVWRWAGTRLVGLPPAIERLEGPDGWQDEYIVRLEKGWVVAFPYMTGDRRRQLQAVLDRVAALNTEGKPVVMMGHQAVAGMDPKGHGFEVGSIKTQEVDALGAGYDYLALGHIHKPQTIGHQEDGQLMEVTYPAGVIRYAGSALHVSCDEQYPHTVSVVDIPEHGGDVHIRQLRIDEWRHFYTLPLGGSSFTSEEEALQAVKDFSASHARGYFSLRVDYRTSLSSTFNQRIYDLLAPYGDEVRYNPKIVWTGRTSSTEEETPRPIFEVAELQQMTDPMEFIGKTLGQYPELDWEELKSAFQEVKAEVRRMEEEEQQAARMKAAKRKTPVQEEQPS